MKLSTTAAMKLKRSIAVNDNVKNSKDKEINTLENDPRRFFAMVKSEVKELDQEENLLNITRYDLMQAALEHEIANYRENSLKLRAKSYGFLLEILVITILLAFVVLFIYLDIKFIAIVFAVVLLGFLIVSNISSMRKNSIQEKVGFILLAKFKNPDEIKFKDEELIKELEAINDKRNSLRAEFSSTMEKSEYLKHLPEEFLNLYSINSLYDIARSKEADTVTQAYDKLREQIEKAEEE